MEADNGNCIRISGEVQKRRLQFTLFMIPIINSQKQRGIMCESCGNIVPLSKQEYKERKKNAADAKA